MEGGAGLVRLDCHVAAAGRPGAAAPPGDRDLGHAKGERRAAVPPLDLHGQLAAHLGCGQRAVVQPVAVPVRPGREPVVEDLGHVLGADTYAVVSDDEPYVGVVADDPDLQPSLRETV